jgi:F0F1-type ATP synthase membrane subunit c/vacuolar-type H+-ATPase subunit K
MNLYPQQEKELRTSLLIARIIVSAICFMSVFMYALVYFSAVLKSDISKFVFDYSQVPFREPTVIILLAISAITFLTVIVVFHSFYQKAKPKTSSVLFLNIVVSVLASAFLETIAIYGLVLSFMYKENLSALTFTMFGITILGGILIFPKAQRWQFMYENSLSNSAK